MVFLVMLGAATITEGGTIYVDANAPGPTRNGTSWATAFLTIQEGLDTAASSDEVWVAAGTYVECVTLKYGVALYGGFTGTETLREQRDWSTNITILDGNHTDSVVTSPSGLTLSSRIDGFTIRNGSTSWYGGGIHCSYSSPTIVNNTITGNSGDSGGIGCYTSSPMIYDNIITGNNSDTGGGIYCENSSPEIRSNEITNNRASGYWANGGGGGISCKSSSSPVISNNIITGNSAFEGGAGIFCSVSSPTISNNTITNNSTTGATSAGGGINCSSSSPTIVNNTITGNTTVFGGGVYSDGGSSTTISNNVITGNSANVGGGIAYRGNSSPSCTLSNNHITENTAGYGGAICCLDYASPIIANNEITNNTATDIRGGAGIYCGGISGGSSPAISNNTIVENRATDRGVIVCSSSSYPTIANNIIAFGTSGLRNESGSTPTLLHNCVFGHQYYDYLGLPDPTGTNGNISADPELADRTSGNLHLLPSSPCIDAGDNSAVPSGITTDLDGHSRFIDDLCTTDTGNGMSPIVDMGAYEFLSSDIDSNGSVDLVDFSRFALYWRNTGCGACGGADLTCDGNVNLYDLKDFCDNWLADL